MNYEGYALIGTLNDLVDALAERDHARTLAAHLESELAEHQDVTTRLVAAAAAQADVIDRVEDLLTAWHEEAVRAGRSSIQEMALRTALHQDDR